MALSAHRCWWGGTGTLPACPCFATPLQAEEKLVALSAHRCWWGGTGTLPACPCFATPLQAEEKLHHGTAHFEGGGHRCGFTPVKVESVPKSPLEELEAARL